MIKILLVYEDYNELATTESYLKKVGFDVNGVNNELLISEQILTFNPEVIVAHGKNQKVSSLSVGHRLKENKRFHGHSIIIVPRGVKPAADEMLKMKIDALLEAPVQPEKLLQILGKIKNIDPAPLIEKYQRFRSQVEAKSENVVVSGGSGTKKDKVSVTGGNRGKEDSINVTGAVGRASSAYVHGGGGLAEGSTYVGGAPEAQFQDPARAARYAKYTSEVNIDLAQSSHSRQELRNRQKEIKKDWDFDRLEEIDALKRQFAEALFKKKV